MLRQELNWIHRINFRRYSRSSLISSECELLDGGRTPKSLDTCFWVWDIRILRLYLLPLESQGALDAVS